MDSKTETVSDFKKDIAEVGDIMIADFIGKRVWDKELMKDGRDQQWNIPMCIGYYPTIKTMKFKTSWDWLIPVVEKIAKTEVSRVKIEIDNLSADCNIYKNGWGTGYQNTYDDVPLIQLVYKSVVSYIKKVNSQSPDTIK